MGAQKIVELPWTGDSAPGGAPLIGVSLALIELAHRTAPTRAEGFRNAQFLALAFGSLGFLAGQIEAKAAATVLLGLPLVLTIRAFLPPPEGRLVAA